MSDGSTVRTRIADPLTDLPLSRSARPQNLLTTGLLLLVLLLAVALRFYRLDAQSLWNDEGTSVAMAQRDLATITRDAAYDIHPPLYYWLLSAWVRLFGPSEVAVRSLSALLGVALVALIYPLGYLLAGRWAGLASAFLAAINPFQVYYSQEARMYMLLAVLGTLAFYAALMWAASGPDKAMLRWGIVYVLAGAAGLYTHYAFTMVLLAVNLVLLTFIGQQWQDPTRTGKARPAWAWLGYWALLQGGIALLFVPWLPTAVRQVTTWPQVEPAVDRVSAFIRFSQLFSTGPAAPPWRETWLALLLLLVTFYPAGRNGRLPRLVAYLTPVLWLVVPIVLILALGLYKEAYLKFLLAASPAFLLLAGRFLTAPLHTTRRIVSIAQTLLCVLVALLLVSASVHGLHHYYSNPAYARDDYRAIATYIDAVGRPGDAVLLNAPGQQEVFGYYFHGDLPVYPLPERRPLEPAATEEALKGLARPGGRIFSVFWATDESDPGRFVEGWLDSHTYKALDSWYGNVRLVVYSVPKQTPTAPDHTLGVGLQSAETGDEITLLSYSLLNDRLAAGDIAQVTLFWQADRTPTRRYKVFLHILDEADQIVGQRDAEPGGGAQLTTLWEPGEVLADNHGVPIHPATPPGSYRVEVGLYDPETGQRLSTPAGESQVWLEPLMVGHPPAPAPIAALGMQHAERAGFGELTLLGYDAYRLGFAHLAEVPLQPGDTLHVNLYWQAEGQPSGDWQVTIDLVDSDGRKWTGLTAEPVGAYPTNRWQASDVWRGQFNLPIPGNVPPGRYWLRVQPIAPDGTPAEPFLSEPLTVTQ